MQIEEEEKIYRIGNGSIRACLRGKVKRYPDVEVSPPPRRRERGVQRRRPRPERDNRGGSGCDEDERDKGIDNIIEVKKKKRRKFNFSERGDVEQWTENGGNPRRGLVRKGEKSRVGWERV